MHINYFENDFRTQQSCEFTDLLSAEEMKKADQLTIKAGSFSGYQLMQRAGTAVAEALLATYPYAARIAVLCGPGNNGGDGYITAEILRCSGVDSVCYALKAPKEGSDAERAEKNWHGKTESLSNFKLSNYDLVVDALFGAGLDRPLDKACMSLISEINQSAKPVVAVDLPSGVCSSTGQVLGAAFQASMTVTFFRYKPGHWLYPGRGLSGKLLLADIGIDASLLNVIKPKIMLNSAYLWQKAWPALNIFQHKYSRGHAVVFSGPATQTGAGRLAAHAALRVGAGAVTLLSPKEALNINAAHLTSIMLKLIKDKHDVVTFMKERKVKAAVLGPGFSDIKRAEKYAALLLENTSLQGVVLDADALTAFQGKSEILAKLAKGAKAPLVITPHEGEFARLFPDLAADQTLSRIEKAQQAIKRLPAVIVYKGPDTIIAAPDGRITINGNGTPLLATAGSGDVLSGLIAGLLAQKMPAFEAACAAVWLHAECARAFGAGLIAEDIPAILPEVLQRIAD